MHYVTWKNLRDDVSTLAGIIPDKYDTYVGIPRSGLMVASLLALHRNRRLGAAGCPAYRIFPGGKREQKLPFAPVPITVDDSVLSLHHGGVTNRLQLHVAATLGSLNLDDH